MKIHVVEEYPMKDHEALVCDDCFGDIPDEQKDELRHHELRDRDAVLEDDICEGACGRNILELMDGEV